MAVARGDEPADLVLAGGHVLSVFTKEWLDVDVAIKDGHVVGLGRYEGHERVEVAGAYVVPGFIDAHMHIESSKLTVDEFARAVLPHGTTAVVADPHEIANVLGTDGIHWLLDCCEDLPLDVYVMASSCVPASRFESPRRPFTPGDIESLLRRHRTIGVAEMMNFPGVIAGLPSELAKLETGLTDHVDGHAPGVRGPSLNAYIAAGIRSDHEATTYEEALEKRRLGMWVMLREASIAHNLRDLLPLVKRHGTDWCMLCTDDREPDFIVEHGHINQMVRVAVEEGVSPEDAMVMATVNPATYHRLWHLGAIAPGYQADILVLDDLKSFRPRQVFKRGAAPRFQKLEVPDWVKQTVNMAPVDAPSFRIPAGPDKIRVIGVIPEQLLTRSDSVEPCARDGQLVADPARDLVKIAVIERHHASGRIGLGFATNVGLKRGAFASTVAHDAHNVVVLGVNDQDMAECATRLAEIGGGVVIAEGGRVVDELPLPVAGLMSDRPLAEVHQRLRSMEGRLAAMGVTVASPFMTLSFLALSVIPELKITDRGLVDVARFELVPLGIDQRGLERFNSDSREAAETQLYSCFAHHGWASLVAAGRPYRDRGELMAAAESAWSNLGRSDWLESFAAHPRIGERGGQSPTTSDREQSRVMSASGETLAAIAGESRRYEERFGHVFLVAASERSADEILQSLRQRMANDPDTELSVAAAEQRKITRLRLDRLLG